MAQSHQKPFVLLLGDIEWAHDEWNALSDVVILKVMTESVTAAEKVRSRIPRTGQNSSKI